MSNDDESLTHEKAANVMASAALMFLKPKEGVVIECEDAKYAVMHDNEGGILILSNDNGSLDALEHGQLLWDADSEDQAAERNALEAMGIPVDPNNPPEYH